MKISSWWIWAIIVSAAVITLLVLVIIYMNKTSNVTNITDVINKYGPPNTYIGATDLESGAKNFNLNTPSIDTQLLKFTVDKTWKAGTSALVSGKVLFNFDSGLILISDPPLPFTFSVPTPFIKIPGGSGILDIDSVTSNANNGDSIYLDLEFTTIPLNPGDVVYIQLITDSSIGANGGNTVPVTGQLMSNTYTPVTA
jgi:hypothetical protein